MRVIAVDHGDWRVKVEKWFEGITRARGEGTGLYVRDPGGYRMELKFY